MLACRCQLWSCRWTPQLLLLLLLLLLQVLQLLSCLLICEGLQLLLCCCQLCSMKHPGLSHVLGQRPNLQQ
jgi:hypothetical protein